jgi:hypothetical protein
MKKMLFIVTITLLSCSADRSVRWLGGSFTEALETASALQKPILIDFYSDT